MCQEEIGLWLKNGGIELVTKKIQDLLTPCTDSTDSVLPQSSFCTQVYNIDNKKEKSNKKKEFVPPTYEEVKAFFIENQEPLEKLDKCFTYYNDANWTNRDGKKVKDWKRTIKTNWFSKNKNRDGHHNVPPAAPSRKLHESFNFKITNNDI